MGHMGWAMTWLTIENYCRDPTDPCPYTHLHGASSSSSVIGKDHKLQKVAAGPATKVQVGNLSLGFHILPGY